MKSRSVDRDSGPQSFSCGGVEGHAQVITTQRTANAKAVRPKSYGATAWVGVRLPEQISLLLDEVSQNQAWPAVSLHQQILLPCYLPSWCIQGLPLSQRLGWG